MFLLIPYLLSLLELKHLCATRVRPKFTRAICHDNADAYEEMKLLLQLTQELTLINRV